MSTLATAEPNELRPLLHERIDQCSLEELDALRKLLLEREAKRLFDAMAMDAEADRLGGKHDPALVDAAIHEHRARHPYR
jgi:hypothetical protein